MDLHNQVTCLKWRIANLSEHCLFHKTDKDAKRLLKKLKVRARSLRAALKVHQEKNPPTEKVAKVPRVKKEKEIKRSPEQTVKINSFLEARAKIRASAPVGQQ
jgi:ribosomal protein S15P/S13E